MDLISSEYAEEFAVVFAWVSALLPWSVSAAIGSIELTGANEAGSLVQIHAPFLVVRFLFNIDVPGPNPLVMFPWESISYYAGAPGPIPFVLYTASTFVIALTLLLTLAMWGLEEQVAEARFDEVRTVGGLLLVSAVLLTLSAVVLTVGAPVDSVTSTSFVGVVIPIGLVFQYVFAYALLTVDRDVAATPTAGSGGE